MALTTVTPPGAATPAVVFDLLSTEYWPISKLAFGPLGTATVVDATNRLPVALPDGLATEETLAAIETALGDQATEATLAAIETALGALATQTTAAAIEAKLPALAGGRLPAAIQAAAETVGEPTFAGARQAVGTTSAGGTLPTLGASRRMMMVASSRCYVRTGTSGVTAALDGNSQALPADLPFTMIVPTGHTHFAVIRDTADGALDLMPQAG